MDHLSRFERVKIGTAWEPKISTCLNGKYAKFGYNLKESTFREDCDEKTDRWQISQFSKPGRVAIKVRLDEYGNLERIKTDILIALFDPFYGVDDPRTVIGRDMKYEYSMYISVIRGAIRVANGKIIHLLCQGMWDDYLPKARNLKIQETGSGDKKLYSLPADPSHQISLHYDAKSGHPKMLAFVNPFGYYTDNLGTYSLEKYIRTHSFTEKDYNDESN